MSKNERGIADESARAELGLDLQMLWRIKNAVNDSVNSRQAIFMVIHSRKAFYFSFLISVLYLIT